MSGHLATLVVNGKSVDYIDFGQPMWTEYNDGERDPETGEFLGLRLIPRPGREIAEALAHYFGSDLRLSISLDRFPVNEQVDSKAIEASAEFDTLCQEAYEQVEVVVDLIVMDGNAVRFAKELESFKQEIVVRSGATDDYRITENPFA